MQNNDKTQRRLIFLNILNIIVLVLVIVLSNLTYAQENQELHQKTLYEIANHTSSKQNAQITVGKGPKALAVYEINMDVHKVYVANYLDNTISVIDGKTMTKIGNDIKVGNNPAAIGDDFITSTIYVANQGDNTISVIDGNNNTKIGDDIKVGSGPSAISFEYPSNILYVANYDDGTVSVIDGIANKVVAKVMFNIEPLNAGNIECDKNKLIVPIAQEFYIWNGYGFYWFMANSYGYRMEKCKKTGM